MTTYDILMLVLTVIGTMIDIVTIIRSIRSERHF